MARALEWRQKSRPDVRPAVAVGLPKGSDQPRYGGVGASPSPMAPAFGDACAPRADPNLPQVFDSKAKRRGLQSIKQLLSNADF